MTPSSIISLCVSVSCALIAGAIPSLAASNPEDFFGGQDHQAYLEWVEQSVKDFPNSYFISSSANPAQGVAIHWKISVQEGYIDLGVAAKAKGWLSFGLSDNGGMTGSDMFLFETANPSIVTDAYVQDTRLPQDDGCQDWLLVDSSIESDFLMVKVRRLLVTGDTQDIPIRNDSGLDTPVHRVIAAWGDSGETTYHGPNVARSALRFFGSGEDENTAFLESMAVESNGSVFVGAKNYPIKPQDTEYINFCLSADDMRSQGVNLETAIAAIGFEPVIDNAAHVHHFIVSASYEENNGLENCNLGMPEFVYGWAPGEPSLALPSNVGFVVGGNDGYKSFMVEIHYDNPSMKTGEIDSSGVKIYYSNQMREHVAGLMVVGDSTVALNGQNIARGLTDYSFTCPSSCTTLAIDEPVTVFRETLHMHQSGVSAYNQHIRDGKVIRTGKAEYFDFRQQGGHVVQQEPFQLQSRDSFHTKCFFKNDDDRRKFGLSSSEEMCMAFLLYYPRKELPGFGFGMFCGVGLGNFGLSACESEWKTVVLNDEGPMQRTFGTPSSNQCLAPPMDGLQGGSPENSTSGGQAWVNGKNVMLKSFHVTILATAAVFML